MRSTSSVGNHGRGRTLPVVRWLQLGTVATGIGIAMLAAPAVASADAGGGSSTANSSHSSASGGSSARNTASVDRHPTTAGSGRRGAASPAASARGSAAGAQATGVRTRRVAVGTPRIMAAATTPSASPATAGTLTTADRVGGSQALQSISDALQQALASAANRLANEPPTPVNRFLRDSVYLIQRTLFPASVGVITRPIKVPLYFQAIDNAGTQKLGIYVSLGYGAPPQLFEFDTGAGGFYAAYASDDPTKSPWWGSDVVTDPIRIPIQDTFDSGLQYTGYSAVGTVSLYTVGSSTPLVTSGNIAVGQMDSITNTKTGDVLWTPSGLPKSDSPPPIDNAFYGDFGIAPTYSANGIDQVIAQLTFGRGVKAGYVVHIDPDTGEAWMQIGLTNNNIANSQGMYFPMLPDPKNIDDQSFPNSGLHFYGLQLFNAAINIIDRGGNLIINDPNVGITPDTGATTTLHNVDKSPHPDKYNSIIDWDSSAETVGKLKTDMLFWLTGTTTGQTPVRYFQFVTTDDENAGKVKVQDPAQDGDTTPVYYLNTGISLFYEYDVVYYLGTKTDTGTLGLIPQKKTS
ncbi:hypothetical protein [Mycolicibacterium vinylchloridicum]|uniref:hypothetical protein n=1 Tax=Mycolicibacterium vinylchloridicum TaxID=2736928 RepID=UPI0015C880DA|nr:hypothetical protein [Mycolicibacterium vinylchloridicum]